MTNGIAENLHSFGPVFAAVWAVTFLCAVLWPQRFRNSFLLLGAIWAILGYLLFVSPLLFMMIWG